MTDREVLLAAARAVRAHAYAPYSGFAVGAAIRSESGTVYAAANVENVAYPVGLCAEAGALAALIAAGERCVMEVLVLAEGETLCTPCGACRQRLAEFARPEVPVHVAGTDGIKATFTLGALLPEAFTFDARTLSEKR